MQAPNPKEEPEEVEFIYESDNISAPSSDNKSKLS